MEVKNGTSFFEEMEREISPEGENGWRIYIQIPAGGLSIFVNDVNIAKVLAHKFETYEQFMNFMNCCCKQEQLSEEQQPLTEMEKYEKEENEKAHRDIPGQLNEITEILSKIMMVIPTIEDMDAELWNKLLKGWKPSDLEVRKVSNQLYILRSRLWEVYFGFTCKKCRKSIFRSQIGQICEDCQISESARLEKNRRENDGYWKSITPLQPEDDGPGLYASDGAYEEYWRRKHCLSRED